MTPTPETRGAIIAAYAAGHTIASICAEHGVSRWTINRYAAAAGLPKRTPRTAIVRPVRRCACGLVTTSLIGECQWCQLSFIPPAPVDEADALPEGDWVFCRRSRVMRWEAA